MKTEIATPHVGVTTDASIQIRQARQGLLVFAIFLIPLSLFGYWFNVKYPDLDLVFSTLPMMFAPGIASILTRLERAD